MNVFPLEEGAGPLYERLYRHLSREIRAGNLSPGERLPSKKALAAHLHVSRNTVETAYSMLAAEGYLIPKARSGYFVAEIDALIAPTDRTPLPASADPPETDFRWDFRTNAVDLNSFPFATWTRLSREVMRSGTDLLALGDAGGDRELRECLAKYLHEFRGVVCEADQVVVGAGMEYLLTLLCELLDGVDSVAVEDPGYRKTAAILRNSGRRVLPIPLDQDGMTASALRESGAGAAYITPSHQFPTGIVMPVGRRAELLNWAGEQENRWLIEDDYNSEFHFSGRPIPAAQGLDSRGKVIYLSTFSRTLAPSIRIAYLVLPRPLAERYRRRFRRYSSSVSRFEQQTLAKFISGGYLSRHLNRVKNIYRRRRDELIPFFRSIGGVTVSEGKAGLHLLIHPGRLSREALAQRAEKIGLRLYFLSDYRFRAEPEQRDSTLVLGYAGADAGEIKEAFTLLFSSETP